MKLQRVAGAIGLAVAFTLPSIASAQSGTDGGDIDCKVILCLAGGFPSPSCNDALSYMLDRISPPRPKPPFGFCPMSNGEEYTNYDAPYARLNTRSASGWDCPEGKRLFFRRIDEDHGRDRIEAWCYSHTTTTRTRDDGDWQSRTVYHGRSSATPVNFQIQITVEPGTEQQWVSPTYRINYNTGYMRQILNGSPLTTHQEATTNPEG
ncbi:hypothetical protein [Roseobacter weihaiensis]|uniref:hypothetical protein n=1 Tax=Roseobacter weihaiensis TaxID=2763262 RepID=UPI001D0B0695|nr:hypothetical protein [Roseobacter sp. H9]